MPPLRILQVFRAPVGGLFRHVVDLSTELARRGHLIGVVADSGSGDAMTEVKLEALGKVARLGVTRLPMPRLLGLADYTTPRRIGALAQALSIDILHGHGAKGGFAARFAGAPNGAARFYTPHGGALHYDPRTPVGAAFMMIERRLLRHTDTIVFESRYAQETYRTRVATPGCIEAVIHNGLGESEFEPVYPVPDAADFVFVGELRLLKGIDLLVEALARVTRPDGRGATLMMAGDGPDRSELENQIERLGLSGRVTLAGVQPAREMFARGRVVVVPSRAESLPYIVLEAGAAARPVIATRVGGITEIFGPTAGALIAPDSVDALVTAMQQVLHDPAAAREQAHLRHRFIREHFSLPRMVDRIEAAYRVALMQDS